MHTKRIDDKQDVENRSMAEINELKTRIRCKQRAIQLADLVLQKTKEGNQLEAIDAGVLDAVKTTLATNTISARSQLWLLK